MRDELVATGLLVAFATLATAHVLLVAGLAARQPRWRALVALVAAPLAPYWGHRTGMHARSVMWTAGAVAYALSLWLARR
jgi:hypothetical protein